MEGSGSGGSGSSDVVVAMEGSGSGGSVTVGSGTKPGSSGSEVVEVDVVVDVVATGASVVVEDVGGGIIGSFSGGAQFNTTQGSASASAQAEVPSANTLLSSGSSQFDTPSQSLSRFTSTIENLSPVGATPALMMLV